MHQKIPQKEIKTMDKTKRILIADESPDQRRALRENLQRAGFHQIEEAANGEDALMKIDKTAPDVVIVDL